MEVKKTLREIYYWLNSIQKNTSYVLVIFILFFACAGLIIFSFRGIVNDNFEAIYFFIGTAITLSGFTMLSGMFEKTGNKNKIEKNLFFLSILFLFSAFSFILFIGLYSVFKDAKLNNDLGGLFWRGITFLTYYLGIFPFFIGFTTLILVLIQHYYQIDLDAAPEEIKEKQWWQFWK